MKKLRFLDGWNLGYTRVDDIYQGSVWALIMGRSICQLKITILMFDAESYESYDSTIRDRNLDRDFDNILRQRLKRLLQFLVPMMFRQSMK